MADAYRIHLSDDAIRLYLRSRRGEVAGDGKYNNRSLGLHPAAAEVRYRETVVKFPAGVKGYVHLQYRWVVGRTPGPARGLNR